MKAQHPTTAAAAANQRLFHKLSGEMPASVASDDVSKPVSARRRSSITASDPQATTLMNRVKSAGNRIDAAIAAVSGQGGVSKSVAVPKRTSMIRAPQPKPSTAEDDAAAARKAARLKQQEELRARIKESRAKLQSDGPRSDEVDVVVFVPNKPPPAVSAIRAPVQLPGAPSAFEAQISPVASAKRDAIDAKPSTSAARVVEHGRRAGQVKQPSVSPESDSDPKR